MEDDLKNVKMEDDLKNFKIEDDLRNAKWKTTKKFNMEEKFNKMQQQQRS